MDFKMVKTPILKELHTLVCTEEDAINGIETINKWVKYHTNSDWEFLYEDNKSNGISWHFCPFAGPVTGNYSIDRVYGNDGFITFYIYEIVGYNYAVTEKKSRRRK